jgi:hypothetical protein
MTYPPDNVTISYTPIESTIQIMLNGATIQGLEYTASTRTIQFDEAFTQKGELIVAYDLENTCD